MSNSPQNIETTYDIAIIGGGVNGCGIARDAAGRGLSVLLVEKDDLASGTSSASTKLVHGGLRYLEQYEFILVRKALKEREVLLNIAPHIVSPLRLVLPHHKSLRPKWMIRIGLFLYDTLGGRKLLQKSRQIDLRKDPAGRALKNQFTYGFEYADCRVDDSRLVVLNAMDAAEKGAKILTRTILDQAHRNPDCWQLDVRNTQNGKKQKFNAKILINAAGPWVSQVISDRVMLDAKSDVRLVKGSHIVVPKLFGHDRAYMFQNPDNRIIFAIPYQGDFTLLGTTDVDITGHWDRAEISDDEIDYLCNAANAYFEKQTAVEDVVWKFSGIRPLFDDGESSAQEITRDYVLELLEEKDAPPALSVFGGKITTYRVLAQAVLEDLSAWLPNLKPQWTHTAPLPGGDFDPLGLQNLVQTYADNYPFLENPTLLRMVKAYGTRTPDVLTHCQSINDMGQCFGADLYQREVDYLIEKEWATTVEDIIWRRSKLGLFMTKQEIDNLAKYLKSK